MPAKGAGVKPVQAVLRALQILETLGQHDRPLALGEIASNVGLNESTTYRLLQTMAQAGFVSSDRRRGFRLTAKLFDLAQAAIPGMEVRTLVRPLLEEVVARCNETANIVLFDGVEVVYVDQVQSRQTIRILAEVGRRLPAYATASGKVFLAHLPPEHLERYLRTVPLHRFTAHTIADPERLRQHLAVVRQRGYAEENQEMEEGVSCVAAPIRDAGGKVVAVLSISGPTARWTDALMEGLLIPTVREYAERMSQLLRE
ncbi:MAG: IclR family transcriptional regulator [Limnochordales bacterium]|nr:IclR family transcriptional regulator [Limnochordales bacterium]